ncbi:MAG TPA: metalloregulator ArsR/SmtB family transcription factor [Baekduia sp.]|nr:metalloregulator ArsR/SmtB family transcription factor [Baekduia sp.]
MTHPQEHRDPDHPLDQDEAGELADIAALLATASRVRLLFALLDGERTVDELARHLGMEQPAVSHQLRVLRQGRLVRVRRAGRHAHYRLFDHHVPDLLAALRHHREHLGLPISSPAEHRETTAS